MPRTVEPSTIVMDDLVVFRNDRERVYARGRGEMNPVHEDAVDRHGLVGAPLAVLEVTRDGLIRLSNPRCRDYMGGICSQTGGCGPWFPERFDRVGSALAPTAAPAAPTTAATATITDTPFVYRCAIGPTCMGRHVTYPHCACSVNMPALPRLPAPMPDPAGGWVAFYSTTSVSGATNTAWFTDTL